MTAAKSETPEFDHLLHWVADVPATVAEYTSAGMPAQVNAELDGFQNGGWRIDERYVELLTVTNEHDLRHSRYATGLQLIRPAIDALGGGYGAATFAVNVTDARQTATRLRRQGHRVHEVEVALPEFGASFVEVFVLDPSRPWTPFFITYDPPRDEILRGVEPGAFDPGRHDLRGLQITSRDPQHARAELSELLGIDAAALPGAEISFTHGDREAITAVILDGSHPGAEIAGLRFRSTESLRGFS